LVGLAQRQPLDRHGECAVLHGADGVAVAGRLSAFGNFEEGEQAVVAYIEKVMADPL
jgi:hypothetical protein